MLLTTHYLEEADALADRIVVLHEGAIISDGTPTAIKARVAGRRIRCRTRLSAAELRLIGGVHEATVERPGAARRATSSPPTAPSA